MKQKIKKTPKIEIQPINVVDPDTELVEFVKRNHSNAVTYRQKFTPIWDKIVKQIRCVHPDDWGNKDDWQSKIFIPQQAKKTETAASYLDKMLFGQKRFFSIVGNEGKDKERDGFIADLYDTIFDRGNFYLENDFILGEGCNIGTAFCKVLVKPDRTGLDFIWRSAYNISFDPTCGYNFYKAKYVCDEYKKTINELVDELKKPNPLYSRSAVQKVIKAAEEAGKGKADQDLCAVKSIDGTEQVQISKDWFELNIVEYWGKVKTSFKDKEGIEKYSMVDKIVVTVNDRIKIRDVENPYGFIPIFTCRVKPRGYDTYGLGFCENTLDLQELTNSMINLGFDSLKLCSMDIAVVDATKIKDPASIEYRPMATWLVKGDPRQAVMLSRQGISALGEIIRGLTVLDQFDQEASGVLRQVQGAPELAGSGSETLGEFQAKLAMVDNRFLKVGRFIERDYIEPLLKGVFKIIFNPKFFNQQLIDRILGFKEVDSLVQDHMTGQSVQIKQQVSKLNFDEVANAGDMSFDFKAVGMTQYAKAVETLQKLKELLTEVIKNPQLGIIAKVDEIFKRVLQAAEIGDYQDLIKSDDEIKQIMNSIYQGAPNGQQGPAGPAGPGIPGIG